MSKLEAMFYALRRNALETKPKAVRALFLRAQKIGMFTRIKPETGGIVYKLPETKEGRIVALYRAERQKRSEQEGGERPRTHAPSRKLAAPGNPT